MDEDTWDEPSADPAIRTEYEAALGRFILAFNEADYRLSQVIATELSERGQSVLTATAAKGTFAQRLEKLEILVSTTKNRQLSAIPIEKLRLLNGDRNKLAHGHFDQNPYDGSYTLVLAAKAGDYPISRILALTEELTQIVGNLRTAEILYDFKDLSDESTGNGSNTLA